MLPFDYFQYMEGGHNKAISRDPLSYYPSEGVMALQVTSMKKMMGMDSDAEEEWIRESNGEMPRDR